MLKVASKTIYRLRAWILSFLVLAVILIIVESAKPFQECINENYYNPATENFEKSIPSFSVAFGIYRDCVGAFTHNNAEAIIAAFTIILALSTIFLWVATRDLVINTENTARRQLRAYVFVVQVEIVDMGTPNVNAAVKIRNTGQTPAYDVTVSTGANAFNVPGNVTFTPTPIGPNSSRFVFGPDGLGRYNIPLQSIIGAANRIAAIKTGNGALYVWGEILYKDAFGKGQYTRFRHMIGGTAGWPSDNLMTVCPEGNEAS